MRCSAPFWVKDISAFVGCGKCLGCLINRRRKWTLRNILELRCHREAIFVTLTYTDETIHPLGHLVPRDLTLFLKRFRKAIEPIKVRFYACGEYGGKSLRPHYHLILYGVGAEFSNTILRTWNKGMIDVKSATKENIEYVAGYCTKKLLNSDTRISRGMPKEFVRSSRRPGIGVPALAVLADKWNLQMDGQDVLRSLKIGAVDYPLDRLMREKLRNLVFTKEQIEQIKEVYKDVMREEAKSLIVEARDYKTWLLFKDRPQQLSTLASEVYYEKHYSALEAQQKKWAFKQNLKRNSI